MGRPVAIYDMLRIFGEAVLVYVSRKSENTRFKPVLNLLYGWEFPKTTLMISVPCWSVTPYNYKDVAFDQKIFWGTLLSLRNLKRLFRASNCITV